MIFNSFKSLYKWERIGFDVISWDFLSRAKLFQSAIIELEHWRCRQQLDRNWGSICHRTSRHGNLWLAYDVVYRRVATPKSPLRRAVQPVSWVAHPRQAHFLAAQQLPWSIGSLLCTWRPWSACRRTHESELCLCTLHWSTGCLSWLPGGLPPPIVSIWLLLRTFLQANLHKWCANLQRTTSSWSLWQERRD